MIQANQLYLHSLEFQFFKTASELKSQVVVEFMFIPMPMYYYYHVLSYN